MHFPGRGGPVCPPRRDRHPLGVGPCVRPDQTLAFYLRMHQPCRRIAMTIQAINPATEAVLATYEEFTPEAVDAAVAAAHAAFAGWRLQPPVARAACLRAAAATLRARQSRYAA